MPPVNQYAGGFADAPIEAAYAFREAMNAMARPGDIRTVHGASPPAPLSVAAGVLLLTLCDGTTGVHLAGDLDCPAVRDWLSFHTGAPLGAPETADFAVGAWTALQPVGRFRIGTSDYPDRSATLIVETAGLAASGAVLRGPGIADSARLTLPDLRVFAANHDRYPLGLDFFLTCGSRLAALPRSTRVTDGS